MSEPPRTLVGSTEAELQAKRRLLGELRQGGIPDPELLDNVGLFLTRQILSRIRFFSHLYELALPVHGSILEFGVRWGQDLALLSNLRGILEPFNHNRRIVGFDTFSGFPGVDVADGGKVQAGDYGVTAGWQERLESILAFHEGNSPIPHKRKFELVRGDATVTLPRWLDEHPEAMVALAYFDFDLYAPTKVCLEAIVPRLTRGSVVAFDELNCAEFPGETTAVREVLGLGRYAIRRIPESPLTSYLVVD